MGCVLGRLFAWERGDYTDEVVIALKKSDCKTLKKIISQSSFDINKNYNFSHNYSACSFNSLQTNLLVHAFQFDSSIECIDLLLAHGAVHKYRKLYSLDINKVSSQKEFLVIIYTREDEESPENFAKIQMAKIFYCFHKKNININLL